MNGVVLDIHVDRVRLEGEPGVHVTSLDRATSRSAFCKNRFYRTSLLVTYRSFISKVKHSVAVCVCVCVYMSNPD